jgi:hypothetical protein
MCVAGFVDDGLGEGWAFKREGAHEGQKTPGAAGKMFVWGFCEGKEQQ